MRRLFIASVVALSMVVAVFAQDVPSLPRPAAEIAADLDRLSAEMKMPPIFWVGPDANLQDVLNYAPAGSTVRLYEGATYAGQFVAPKKVLIVANYAVIRATGQNPALLISGDDVTVLGVTFDSAAGASTDTLVVVKRGAKNTRLKNVIVEGNGATRRGIGAQGTDMLFEHIQVKRIGKVGVESQAVAIWDGTGLTIRDSFLEAGSISFLAGGAVTAVPNHVPANILIERCILTHPMEWRGKGYANKNAFELKNARNVVLRDSTLENVWVDSQTGYAIQLTPSASGSTASPETIVEDVLIEHNTIQNVGSGVNMFGFTQQTAPTQRGHNYRFINNTWVLSRAQFGGHGTLIQISHEPADVVFEDNTVIQDGDAFLRAADSKPIVGFSFQRNTLSITGTYGVFTPLGSRGTKFQDVFPGGTITTNDFSGAHPTFKSNFPDNTYR